MRKELAVFCLAYNLVRVVMLEATRRQEVAVARVSFADALRVDAARPTVRHTARVDRQSPTAGPGRAALYQATT